MQGMTYQEAAEQSGGAFPRYCAPAGKARPRLIVEKPVGDASPWNGALSLVEQDHRAIKRRTRPMLGFKTFRCARILLAGIEIMHMIAKGQMKCARGIHPSGADQFYDLAT